MSNHAVVLGLFLAITSPLLSQPLNGEFTVGGPSPSFATLQAAANALKARGVSGPVWFNIRPGIYMEDGGLNSVMVLDSVIAGVSSANRITFQPDQNFGGNVGNTKLQIDLTSSTYWKPLVAIKVDHVTIRNLTLEDVDTTGDGADVLLRIVHVQFVNPITEDIIIEGCRFIGNSHPTGGMFNGTEVGIYGDNAVSNIVIRQNTFQRLLRSVHIGDPYGTGGNVIVEDNQVLNAHRQPDRLDASITVLAQTAIVRRNYLDNSGGLGSLVGIMVYSDSGLVEKNTIKNGGGVPANVPTFRAIIVDDMSGSNARSMLVANNMITGSATDNSWTPPYGGRFGIITSTKAQIIHNTIVHPPGVQFSYGIQLAQGSDSVTVLNNIVVEYGSPPGLFEVPIILFRQEWGTSGLISDYNVFFFNQQPEVYLVFRDFSHRYTTLSAYQAATGLDSNSIGKEIYFELGEDYPHLTDCQAQDPELGGIPYPGIVDDIDGDARSLMAPTRGADEGRLRSSPMFGDVFRVRLPGGAYTIASGKFDNLMADGLAVPGDNQVHLYHNLPSSRSFVQSGTVQTDFIPRHARFFDLDHDGNLDLVVGGGADSLQIFWGDGAGGFPQDTTLKVPGYVASIDTGKVSFSNLHTIVFSVHFRVPGENPPYSHLCYLINDNGRHLRVGIVQRPLGGPLGGNVPDSIDAGLGDFVVGDLDGNNSHEVAALDGDIDRGMPFFVFKDTTVGNHAWGHHNEYHFPPLFPYSHAWHASSIAMGRFSGGALNDLVTLAYSNDYSVLLRNEGNLRFSADSIAANRANQLAAMDYENDGDLDFVTMNYRLEHWGVTVFLNDGAGHFTQELNCFQNFGTGVPMDGIASDFDLDGKTDLAIVAGDSLFVLYNFGSVTGIGNEPLLLTPTRFSLSQNYPNPFNPATTIRFNVPKPSQVTIKIYDMLGREVKTLIDRKIESGLQVTIWDGKNYRESPVASGVYFVRMQAGEFVGVTKIVLVR